MKRYDIKQKDTGAITHSYTAESPQEHQAGWGTLEWTEAVPVLDADGAPVLGEDGLPLTTEVVHPQTYEVIETDITFEHALAECYRKRTASYWPAGDVLDAIFKFYNTGDKTQLQAWVESCAAVKAANPKPVKP